MRIAKLSAVAFLGLCLILTNGCVSEQDYNDLKFQNNTQRRRIAELESQLQAATLELDQLKRKVDSSAGRSSIETSTMQQKIASLEEELRKKKALIASMEQQLLHGTQLPVELSTMLEDFAKTTDMITYDSSRGVVKFKSDLLFEKGSDVVAPSATEAVKSLCKILNTEQGKEFDIIVAGHTDDLRISRPETRAKHPTNWHLSAHRAISVLEVMTGDGIIPGRISVRGFGEYRPIAPNKPGKKGNAVNRRVEIYIVPKGT